MLGTSAKLASFGAASLRPQDVFATSLYTGNGSTQTITNGINLSGEGGLVWIKSRSGSEFHHLVDTIRGGTKALNSNDSGVGFTSVNYITGFNSNGFSLGSSTGVNGNAQTFVGLTFREAPKFFDVVTYTGNGTAQNIAHSLGVVPGMIIVKRTNNSSQWTVFHRSTGGYGTYGVLNLTNAWNFSNGENYFNGEPTASVFSVANGFGDGQTNGNGSTYVAYIFAHDADSSGVVQCGSYTGNGAVPGPTVTLGWRPQFIIRKGSDNATGWSMFDAARGLGSGSTPYLQAHTSAAEAAFTGWMVPVAGGFRDDNTINGHNYIYLAIREPV